MNADERSSQRSSRPFRTVEEAEQEYRAQKGELVPLMQRSVGEAVLNEFLKELADAGEDRMHCCHLDSSGIAGPMPEDRRAKFLHFFRTARQFARNYPSLSDTEKARMKYKHLDVVTALCTNTGHLSVLHNAVYTDTDGTLFGAVFPAAEGMCVAVYAHHGPQRNPLTKQAHDFISMHGKGRDHRHYCDGCRLPLIRGLRGNKDRCPCGLVMYCNRACQEAHWPFHKAEHKQRARRTEETGSLDDPDGAAPGTNPAPSAR